MINVYSEFEKQAADTPEAIALVWKNNALSYAQLQRHVATIAGSLNSRGVSPGAIVALSMDRSPSAVASLLAILRIGGVYLPIDPTYPLQRASFMLADSGACLVLTSREYLSRLENVFPSNLILATDPLGIADTRAVPWANDFAFCDAAYLMYTSGSTGVPKGVLVEHGNLLSFFESMDAHLDDVQSRRTWLAVSSMSFDISLLELLWTLTRGYTVVIHAEQDGIESIPGEIVGHDVSHLQCTPSFASALLRVPSAELAIARLSKMLVGGEVLAPSLAAKLCRVLSGSLLNLYGPTEATIWATVYCVDRTNQCIPIGRPLANSQIYILDENQAPVPTEVIGEICIGGRGIAKGYWKQPGLTSERFIDDPFSAIPGARIYRTGDRGRWLADGNVEFCGRVDDQVKVRGYRIELHEIEATLRNHPSVEEAVVRYSEDSAQLVAYVVVAPHAKLNSPE